MQPIKITLIIVLFLCPMVLFAQETISSTGGNASGSGGSVSYSVGQVTFSTNTGTGGSVEQGVQHSFEVLEGAAIKEAQCITLQCMAYPNPVTDALTLKVNNYNISNLSFQVYNLSGTLLQNKKIEGNETIISTGNLVPSTYFLKVTDNTKEIKVFKIIKN